MNEACNSANSVRKDRDYTLFLLACPIIYLFMLGFEFGSGRDCLLHFEIWSIKVSVSFS